MIAQLLQLDLVLFQLFNCLPHPALFTLMNLIASGFGSAVLLWLLWIILAGVLTRKKELLFVCIQLTVAGILTLFLTEGVLKHIVARPRPAVACFDMTAIASSSFPSGHATFAFAGAYILSVARKRHRWLLLFFAFLTAYSRIYLGKHYPLDVIVGALIGLGIGYSVIYFFHDKTQRERASDQSAPFPDTA